MTEDQVPIRILVIDDDSAIRLSLTFLLETKGYEVSTAADGAEGFAQFVLHRPQIVLSDMVMPGHQGIETIGKIRDLSSGVAIIAMSGSIQGGPASFLDRAKAAGADECLEKPFETDDLLRMLSRFKDLEGP